MADALLAIFHRALSIGWVYDFTQFIGGSSILRRRLRHYYTDCYGRVLDIGGGTGNVGRLLPGGCTLICLDNELPKLERFSRKALGNPLLADGTRIPIRSGTIDFVTCSQVSHHLTSDQLDAVLCESVRVLKSTGSLIFMDAVMKPSRLSGRILWMLDRGSYPRSSVELHQALKRHFHVETWDRLALYHEFVVGVCRTGNNALAPTGGET